MEGMEERENRGQQLTKQKDKVRKESCYLSIPEWTTQIRPPAPIHRLNTTVRETLLRREQSGAHKYIDKQ